jgi:hypothetical protein
MIYDAIEQAYLVVNSNFATDMAALVALKSESGLTTTATIEKRQRAERFIALQAAGPTIGIWGRGVVTQAKVGTGWRDNVSSVVLDYYCTGTDPVKVAKQAELAAEALLKSIDRMSDQAQGVYGAGELRGSVTVDLSDGYLEVKADTYYRRAQITFPLTDRDEPV